MNPEELRKWLETCDLVGEDPLVPRDKVLAAAAAWEKDRIAGHEWQVLAKMYEAVNVKLRKRLEAAEKENGWLKRVLGGIGPFYWMKWVEGPWYATGDMDELAFFRELAALKEKP